MLKLRAGGALQALFLTIAEYMEQVEAVELLAFTRKNFGAIVRSIGFDAAEIGAHVDYGGRPYCAISMTWGGAHQRQPLWPKICRCGWRDKLERLTPAQSRPHSKT